MNVETIYKTSEEKFVGEEQFLCMDKDMYETVVGGALPTALNEDDEPVSLFEAGKRLLEAYAAYMEEQNDAE